ncbi:DUF2971 domain-containing protein [Sphingobium sp. BHU LFT2]|uniref:DUF2971 domain-containing protein n=1 Tax=Sphingobium sp. BHU LFT2 TaxID=2807634 RepID=UPI001BECFCC3|nr:DUF2971 domain-containing protein [Sphingobium sp. BHU LFT2]MBT2246321.1 DUF2971 domain-containing protein [Sphingobium sp. BHU LFT2]
MFYKFMGGCDDSLVEIFEKAVMQGSVRFASVAHFNDPYEFKFTPVIPSRETFDRWHDVHDPQRPARERADAWTNCNGSAWDYNTGFTPRLELMRHMYLLCLTQRWDSHLMWGHYASQYRGFVVCYKPDLVSALPGMSGWIGHGKVTYDDQVPELRWFSAPVGEMMKPTLLTKSDQWAYEAEYRALLCDDADQAGILRSIDPGLIAGVILGPRVPEALIAKAIAYRATNSDFSVDQLSSRHDSYELTTRVVQDNVRVFGAFL